MHAYPGTESSSFADLLQMLWVPFSKGTKFKVHSSIHSIVFISNRDLTNSCIDIKYIPKLILDKYSGHLCKLVVLKVSNFKVWSR